MEKETRLQLLSEHLSELYARKKKISAFTMGAYRSHVQFVLAKSEKTVEDTRFVDDFLNAIVDTKVTEEVVDTGKGQATKSTDAELKPQVVELKELVVVPEKLDGSRSRARRWLDDYERAAISNTWNQPTMAKYFQSYLSGGANDWFAISVQSNATNAMAWAEIRAAFCRYYIGKDEDLALERMLKDMIQKPGEDCGRFIARYARQHMLAVSNVSQSKLVNAILVRLRPEFVERLSNHVVGNIEELNLACSAIEDGIRTSRAAERFRKEAHSPNGPGGGQKRGGQDNRGGRGSRGEQGQRSRPHQDLRSGQRNNDGSRQQRPTQCERCKRSGHQKVECYASKDKDGKDLRNRAPRAPPPPRQPRVNAIELDTDASERPIVITKRCAVVIASITIRQRPALLLYDVVIEGREPVTLRALIDTGSESSQLNAETASIHGFVPKGPEPSLSGANNTPIQCHGTIHY